MKKVVVLGCSGAGKSTLSQALSHKTGVPVFHLDQLFWKPGWVQATHEELEQKILDVLSKESWILDGNLTSTARQRFEQADTVILLDYPTHICLFRVLKRIVRSYGRVRPDMADGCAERFDLAFLGYILTFRRKKSPDLYALIESYGKGKAVYVFRSPKETREFLLSI